MSINSPCRHFLMSDAMILVAATAVGFSDFREPANGWSERFVINSVWLLTSWSLACVLLRLRQPRPPLSRLLNQPGTSGCLAGGLPSLVLQVLALRDPSRLMGYRVGSIFIAGFAVMAVWAVQKIGNELEPEGGWIDRLGIGLGFCWITLFAFYCFPILIAA